MYLKEIPCVNKVTIPYDTVAKRWEVNVKVQHNTLLCCMELIRTGGGGLGTPHDSLYREAPPERGLPSVI